MTGMTRSIIHFLNCAFLACIAVAVIVAVRNIYREAMGFFRPKKRDAGIPASYRHRPYPVTAVRFFGQPVDGVYVKPDCMKTKGTTWQGRAHLHKTRGFSMMKAGDWIVMERDGNQWVTDDLIFCHIYEPDE